MIAYSIKIEREKYITENYYLFSFLIVKCYILSMFSIIVTNMILKNHVSSNS